MKKIIVNGIEKNAEIVKISHWMYMEQVQEHLKSKNLVAGSEEDLRAYLDLYPEDLRPGLTVALSSEEKSLFYDNYFDKDGRFHYSKTRQAYLAGTGFIAIHQ